MKIYWNDDLVADTKNRHSKVKKLIYVEDLEMFRYNQVKQGQKFYNVIARSEDRILIYQMENEDGSIVWRQIEDIHSKEEFEALVQLYFSIGKTRRWENVKFNVPRMMYDWLLKFCVYQGILPMGEKSKKPYFPGITWETWHNNEELFNALNSSYKAGYTFNYTDNESVYHDINIYDFKAFHEALLYYMDFPRKFNKVDKREWENLDNYYGYFKIIVKEDNEFLQRFGKLYNSTFLELKGWFNNIDINFITSLVGVERIQCKALYEVEMKRLPQKYLEFLRYCFEFRESVKDPMYKKFIKLGYEKACGQCGRKRFYSQILEYNEETQSFYDDEGIKNKKHNKYDFDAISNDRTKCWGPDLSWNVWVNSYARLILLTLKDKFGGIYGDTDSIFTPNEITGFYLSQEHKDNCEKGFILGLLEKKGKAFDFKCLGLKRYCWRSENKFEVKMSGANNDIIRNYCNGSVDRFTACFPSGVNPYKYVRINRLGYKEYAWRGTINDDNTLTEDKRVIISCAGSGKTTTLVEEVRNRFESCEDRICVIAFTNKNVDELRERIGIRSSRLEIRTLDSLAASFLDGQIEGEHFDLKLKTATDILRQGYDVPPVHLYVDEFQDLDMTKLNFINAIPCISRFYIGDPNQAIYGYSGAMNLFDTLKGFKEESRNTNYRCPQNINDYAEGFLKEETRPHATSITEKGEINFVKKVPDDNSIIICRTVEQVNNIKEYYPERIIMTIHKSKGLTFDNVTVVGIDKRNGTGDESNIAYVAATRAKRVLNIVRSDFNGMEEFI